MDIFPDGRAHASVYVSERNRTIELARRTNLNYTPPSATNWTIITTGIVRAGVGLTLAGIRLNTNPTPGSTDEVVRVRVQTGGGTGDNPPRYTTLRTWTLDDIPDAGEWLAVSGGGGSRISVEVKGAVTVDDIIITQLQD